MSPKGSEILFLCLLPARQGQLRHLPPQERGLRASAGGGQLRFWAGLVCFFGFLVSKDKKGKKMKTSEIVEMQASGTQVSCGLPTSVTLFSQILLCVRGDPEILNYYS